MTSPQGRSGSSPDADEEESPDEYKTRVKRYKETIRVENLLKKSFPRQRELHLLKKRQSNSNEIKEILSLKKNEEITRKIAILDSIDDFIGAKHAF